MASEIRVNSITNRSGLGTVTFSDTGVVLSGVSTFSTGIVVAAGSASAPSISPSGDSNTGIFFPAADTIAFAEGGVEALRIDSNVNIGIGTASPAAKLDVRVATNAKLLVQDGNTTGNVKFNAVNDAVNANVNLEIAASQTQFFNGGSQSAVITSTGNIGIKTASPAEILHLGGNANKIIRVDGSGVSAFLGSAASDVAQVSCNRSPLTGTRVDVSRGSSFINLNATTLGGSIELCTSSGVGDASLRATVTSSGNLSIANGNLVFATAGTGIDFSATANSSGTMTSELLADYEEGTWTPVWQSTGTLPTLSYATQSGYYVRIGRVVHFWGRIYMNSWGGGGGSGNIRVGGLPYTSNSDSNHGGPLCQVTFSYSGGNAVWPTGVTQVFARVLNNATTLEYIGLGAPTTQLGENAPLQWTTNPQMYNNYFSGSYFV